MRDATTAIQTRSLSKVFGHRRVLSEIDLDVARGESVALTGANGTGKTTLLHLLASALRPSAGEVRWFGRPATGAPAARRLIAMVAHETFLYPHLTLRENLIFAARMCDVPGPARRADDLLRSIGLASHAHRSPTRISQGMRQRVAVARALVHDPRILLLDEPFSGLDAQGADWLLNLLLHLRDRGRTLCFAVHDEQKVRRLAHRVVRLQSGRLEELEREGHPGVAKHSASARAA
jgi:heme exporter protein A